MGDDPYRHPGGRSCASASLTMLGTLAAAVGALWTLLAR